MNANKKWGGSGETNLCSAFQQMNLDRDLIDLGFTGLAYTWKSKPNSNGGVYERLDRVMCSTEWFIEYPSAVVLHLPRWFSDHAPILFMTHRHLNKKNKVYRFEFFWLDHPDFMKVVAEAWNKEAGGVTAKLKDMAEIFKKWSRKEFGHISNEISIAQRKLVEVQKMAH